MNSWRSQSLRIPTVWMRRHSGSHSTHSALVCWLTPHSSGHHASNQLTSCLYLRYTSNQLFHERKTPVLYEPNTELRIKIITGRNTATEYRIMVIAAFILWCFFPHLLTGNAGLKVTPQRHRLYRSDKNHFYLPLLLHLLQIQAAATTETTKTLFISIISIIVSSF